MTEEEFTIAKKTASMAFPSSSNNYSDEKRAEGMAALQSLIAETRNTNQENKQEEKESKNQVSYLVVRHTLLAFRHTMGMRKQEEILAVLKTLLTDEEIFRWRSEFTKENCDEARYKNIQQLYKAIIRLHIMAINPADTTCGFFH